MSVKEPVVAVFDIGKTNKKLLVFNEQYKVVKEEVTCFDEIVDDDGFPCENINVLGSWLLDRYDQLKRSSNFQLKAVNFSTYGASMVHIDASGNRVGYLYNYLKPYPENLKQAFLAARGGEDSFAESTSSPIMGHLNAGLQLYWLKKTRPEAFQRITWSLHFPQYLSFLITGKIFAEMTNVGCHSAMWNFAGMDYHSWVKAEGIREKLADVANGDTMVVVGKKESESIVAGIGLHDSSAAAIPYLASFKEPFIILSTGTWVIGLNPFNKALPGADELERGCLSYLTYGGDPVKTAMLFAGNDHDQQVQRIAAYFNVAATFFKTVIPNRQLLQQLLLNNTDAVKQSASIPESATAPCIFHRRNLKEFHSVSEAYHQLMADLINQQKKSLEMILGGSNIKTIYVDGGFCRNSLYMQFLANVFPGKKVYAAEMIQGTALGAALVLHKHWNMYPVPADLVDLKYWKAST